MFFNSSSENTHRSDRGFVVGRVVVVDTVGDWSFAVVFTSLVFVIGALELCGAVCDILNGLSGSGNGKAVYISDRRPTSEVIRAHAAVS